MSIQIIRFNLLYACALGDDASDPNLCVIHVRKLGSLQLDALWPK